MNGLRTRSTDIIAAEINSIKEQTRKAFLYNSIEIGRRLAEARQMVPHGEWGSWLELNVDYSQSTATNLIKIFDNYAKDQLSLFGDNVKSQSFANLSYSQAVALLGVPEEEREAFIKENDVENMSTRELQQTIKEKQELERKLRESEEKAEKEREAREAIDREYKQLEQQKKEQEELAKKLQEEVNNVNNTSPDQVEKLKKQLENAKKKANDSKSTIEKLERDLKEKEQAPAVEVIPESITKELADLRKKLAMNENKATVKFSLLFDTLVNDFKSLLSALDEVKEVDPELSQKYKDAAIGLIEKMSGSLGG